MSSYRDPAPRGDMYPSEEEMDPTGSGVEPASGPEAYLRSQPGPQPSPTPGPVPTPAPTPGPPPRAA
ncbi:hypothetical protein [Micromonospora sp. NPDC051296]|uniref:hypothetical protein n=1 Tax=Micromonospora sp. NPDC051296 TaxID=3155046 RepID=UPI00343B08BE